jgi:hypothetical protein
MMKSTMPKIVFICLIVSLLLFACTGPEATEEQLQATRVAQEVEVQRAVAATLTASAAEQPEAAETPVDPTATPTLPLDTPTETPTAAAVAVAATPTAAATPTPPAPTATPTTPIPTATRFARVVRPVNGSDNASLYIRGPLNIKGGRYVLVPGFDENELDDPVVFRDRAVFQVEVSDTNQGSEDGAGIQTVEFQISDSTGLVYSKVEQTAPFCAFGGNDPLCPALVFAQAGNRWPSGQEIRDELHDVTIIITTAQGVSSDWFWSFEIDRGYSGATAPVEPGLLVLRPACGTTVDVAAGAPIELRYGIWANRGLERTAANERYIEIEFTLNGETIQGQRNLPPVETLNPGICGRDYEDSYWVYHVAHLDGLASGRHNAQVTFRFTQPVDDGYGTVHRQPFTQNFTIVAQ